MQYEIYDYICEKLNLEKETFFLNSLPYEFKEASGSLLRFESESCGTPIDSLKIYKFLIVFYDLDQSKILSYSNELKHHLLSKKRFSLSDKNIRNVKVNSIIYEREYIYSAMYYKSKISFEISCL